MIQTADVVVYIGLGIDRETCNFTVDVLYQNDVWIAHGVLRGLENTWIDTDRITVTHRLSGKAFAHFPNTDNAKAVCDWLADRLPGFDMATFKTLPAPMKREFGRLIKKHGGRIR